MTSPLHRLEPHCKLVATVGFTLAVVVTPREQVWAFGLYAVAVLIVARLARLPVRMLARRLTVELPFVAFALALPVLAGIEGLWGMWNILAKATLGVAAGVVLTATTPVPDLIRGLERLRAPRLFTTIMTFMVRYLDVIVAEAHRMRIARLSRAHDPRWLWQARAVAFSAGALFIRSYERGERVYLAMLSRGYDGALPPGNDDATTAAHWMVAIAVPVLAGAVAGSAWLLQA